MHYEGKIAKDIELIGTRSHLLRHPELRDHRRPRLHRPGSRRPRCPVLVIGHEVAEKLLPGVDPIGKVGSDRRASLPHHRGRGQAGHAVRALARQVRDHAVQRARPPADLPDQHPRRADRAHRRPDLDAARHGRGRGRHARPPRDSSRGRRTISPSRRRRARWGPGRRSPGSCSSPCRASWPSRSWSAAS